MNLPRFHRPTQNVLGAIAPALLFTVLAASPLHAADSTAPFAIVPPQVAEALKAQAAAPEAQTILRQAAPGLSGVPHPLPRVHTEGTLPHQGIWDESVLAEKDWRLMLDLGLAYRLTGDHRYLVAQARYLMAWLDVYKPSFNPIDETNMDQVLVGYDLTRADLAPITRDKMNTFLRTMAEGYLAAIDKQVSAGKRDIDNWQSHRIKLITLCAFALGDPALIERAHGAYTDHIAVNIRPDGMVDDFPKRDALHYTVYDLEPLTVIGLAARGHGQDWFNAKAVSGASVPLALDWLTPFAIGHKSHEEFVHSRIAFDAQRAQAGVKGFAGMWEPANSFNLYQLAAVLDPKYQAVFEQVARSAGKSRSPQTWLLLLTRAGLGK